MMTTTTPTHTTTTRSIEKSSRATLALRILRLVAITFALLVGFGVASASAATAHADTVAGDSVFGTEVECGGDSISFTVNSDETDGSYAKIWVYDTATEEWVTDDIWVDADYYATFNVADLTFEPGYYMVYVSYAQWNGFDYDYSGEYIDTYEQYYSYADHETSDFCYQGNDLSLNN
jgi:hypothetical protein